MTSRLFVYYDRRLDCCRRRSFGLFVFPWIPIIGNRGWKTPFLSRLAVSQLRSHRSSVHKREESGNRKTAPTVEPFISLIKFVWVFSLACTFSIFPEVGALFGCWGVSPSTNGAPTANHGNHSSTVQRVCVPSVVGSFSIRPQHQ